MAPLIALLGLLIGTLLAWLPEIVLGALVLKVFGDTAFVLYVVLCAAVVFLNSVGDSCDE